MSPVIEIRTYQLHEGTSQRFHDAMQEQALALLRAAGTDVLAARPSLDDTCAYMLVRTYASQDDRIASQSAFYGSDAWRQGPREAIMACIATSHTVVFDADQALVASMRGI